MVIEVAQPPAWARAIGWVGIAAHLVLLFWYSVSGLVAPGWAIAVLLLIWVALLVVAARLRRPRPLLVPLVPLAGVLIWLAFISAGGAWLGWTP